MGDMDQHDVMELLQEIRHGWDEEAIGDDRETKIRNWVKTLEVSLFNRAIQSELPILLGAETGQLTRQHENYRPTVANAMPTPTLSTMTL